MSWFEYLCGCFSRDMIVDYLSASRLNRQVIQQEKCTQELDQQPHSVYQQSQSKSYTFKKVANEDSDDQERQTARQRQRIFPKKQVQTLNDHLKLDETSIQSKDPTEFTVYSKKTNPKQLLQRKLAILLEILNSDVNDDPHYSKIYDSQDSSRIRVYSKSEITDTGKRINVYQFSFSKQIQNAKVLLEKFLQHKSEVKLEQLLIKKQNKELRQIKRQKLNAQQCEHEQKILQKEQEAERKGLLNDIKIQVQQRLYKKVLVVNPQEFLTAEADYSDQDSRYSICCSVDQLAVESYKPKEGYCKGWINLAGIKLDRSMELEREIVNCRGYLNIELDVSVNLNMLKQPAIKEIRSYLQSFICNIEGSDAI